MVRDSVSSTQHPGLTSSLLYGMVQLDTGLTRAGVRGRMIPSKLVPVWSFLTKTANEALRAIFPVRRTIPFQWLWWLVGLYPDFLMDREKARRRSRVERLPADHPFRSDFADTPTKTGLAYIRRQRASGPSPDGSRVAWGLGRG